MSGQVKTRVCIITVAHEARDERIFHKQALSLTGAGYDVGMIAPWAASEESGPVRKLPLPEFHGRVDRLVRGAWRALTMAWRERAAVYHFHDPELLPVGLALKLSGHRVIYDVHEDYSRKILSRQLPRILRTIASKGLRGFEAVCAWSFDHIITADSHVASLFAAAKTTVIANYPPLDFVQSSAAPSSCRHDAAFRIVYVGGISHSRGIGKILDAVDLINDPPVEFHLAGNVSDAGLLVRLKSHPRVVYHGVLPWEQVSGLLTQADVGMLALQPIPAFEYCPGENIIKLWEYLGVGLPVIISNFPKLKKLIEELDAGMSVDPTNSAAIADAIRVLGNNTALRLRLGENGRAAVLKERNWEAEAIKLVQIYRRILSGRQHDCFPQREACG